MKTLTTTFAAFALAGLATPAMAQLTPYEDYTVSEQISTITTVKVDANMMDYYLEGIRQTWVAQNEIAVKLGYMESYDIYVSELPESGQFNLLLVANFANSAALEPNKARYDAFMREWGEANQAASRETSSTVYPNIREITGEYRVRKLTMKPE